MKLKMAAVAALIICALCSCGGGSDKSSSIYTPAPVTPRPTFNTSKYRTKEEINAKQDEAFVIVDNFPTGGYPGKQDEYTRNITVDNEAKALQDDEKERKRKEAEEQAVNELNDLLETISNREYANNDDDWYDDENWYDDDSSDSYDYEDSVSLRTKDSIPDGFSSKNYPYSVYSFDGRTYLGTITLNTSNPNSIWNTSGIYGSPDSPSSVFNPNGIYGASDAMFSAFNENASAPPTIIDSKGNIVGKLTTNLRIADGINPDELKLYASDNNM